MHPQLSWLPSIWFGNEAAACKIVMTAEREGETDTTASLFHFSHAANALYRLVWILCVVKLPLRRSCLPCALWGRPTKRWQGFRGTRAATEADAAGRVSPPQHSLSGKNTETIGFHCKFMRFIMWFVLIDNLMVCCSLLRLCSDTFLGFYSVYGGKDGNVL